MHRRRLSDTTDTPLIGSDCGARTRRPLRAVAVLGGVLHDSRALAALFTLDQTLESFLRGHVDAFGASPATSCTTTCAAPCSTAAAPPCSFIPACSTWPAITTSHRAPVHRDAEMRRGKLNARSNTYGTPSSPRGPSSTSTTSTPSSAAGETRSPTGGVTPTSPTAVSRRSGAKRSPARCRCPPIPSRPTWCAPAAWNGEYYASYGGRSWEDARQYGFICGGGGLWYSNTLKLLSSGDRIWVNVPGTGYVGVGRVTEKRQLGTVFEVDTETGRKPVVDVLTATEELSQHAEDPEKAEYFVRVQWLDTKPESKAVHEVGFFGNQNTVCRPKTPKWAQTVEQLKTHFPNWQG